MRLYDWLRQKEGNLRLADHRLNDVRDEAAKRLNLIRGTFPLFTDHSIRHSESVLNILDEIMPEEIKSNLNEWEIYFLIAAVYLHDTGMAEGCAAPHIDAAWDEVLAKRLTVAEQAPDFERTVATESAKRDFIRDHHHERSEEYIIAHGHDLGLRATDTRAEWEIVGRIALGHRKVNLGDQQLFDRVPFGNNQIIRQDLLAAYLRLADELDTTAHRTPLAEYEALNIYDEVSQGHWENHLSISGIALANGVISISGRCYNHDAYLRLLDLGEGIKAKLVELRRMLPQPYAGRGFNWPEPLPFRDVKVDVKPQGFLPIKIGFELQDKQIIDLIMGERLYNDKTACIRELLQNAVDTCREATEKRPASYRPQIEVMEEDDGRVLRFDDNGMGMNEHIVRQYFARVGISYYSSPDFTKDQHGFQPISQFGIGILSCFMLAERLEVETYREGSDPLKLTITSLTRPFTPQRGSRPTPGTTIRLHLKTGEVGSFSLPERVLHFARYVSIPIVVTTKGGVQHECQRGSMRPNALSVLSRLYLVGRDVPAVRALPAELYAAIDKALETGFIQVEEDGIALGLTLLDGPCGVINEIYELWMEHFGNISSLMPRPGGYHLYQDGFLVTATGPGDWLSTVAIMCDVNLTGNARVRLTADRTRVIDLGSRIFDIDNVHSKAIERIYEQRGEGQDAEAWWHFHEAYYSGITRLSAADKVPAALWQSAIREARFCTFSSKGFQTHDLQTVLDWPGSILHLDPEQHHLLDGLRDWIPSDLLVVIDFQPGHRHRSPSFSASLLLRHTQIVDVDLFSDQVTIREMEIGEEQFLTIDVGKPLGVVALPEHWRLGFLPQLESGRRFVPTVLDHNHPFTRVLWKYCQRTLPSTCQALLLQMDRDEDFSWEDPTLQEAFVEALQIHSVIPTGDEIDLGEEAEVPEHNCPYGDLDPN